jgi:2-oxo-3-hexenedioate decarboxylase
VFGAFEVVDSRYEGFKFGMADVIADNTSAARFVMGAHMRSPGRDLAEIGCVLSLNGETIAFARGDAVLGHPARAVAWVSEELGRAGRTLPAGSVVLSGGMTDFVPLHPGDSVKAVFDELGEVVLQAR